MTLQEAPGLTDRNSSVSASAATGEHSPISGWWRPDGDPAPFRYIQEGAILPALEGKPTVWCLVYSLPVSRRAANPSRQYTSHAINHS